jgi:hypothetical protein
LEREILVEVKLVEVKLVGAKLAAVTLVELLADQVLLRRSAVEAVLAEE